MTGYEALSQAELPGLPAERDRVIAGLRAQVAALTGRLARAERLASRNPGNSPLSPSSDDVLPGRKPKARREHKPGSGRNQGKQPGARGRHLPWAEVPDKTACHRPPRACGCRADLAGAADAGIERSHQVHDQPPAAAQITQHDVRRVRCGCGPEHAGALPADVATVPSSVHDQILQTGLAELTGPDPAPPRKAATIYQAAIDHLAHRAGIAA